MKRNTGGNLKRGSKPEPSIRGTVANGVGSGCRSVPGAQKTGLRATLSCTLLFLVYVSAPLTPEAILKLVFFL